METFTPTRTPLPPSGTRVLQLEAQSGLQVAQSLSRGLPTSSVERLADHLGVSVAQVLELADLKNSTFFERKRKQQRLNPAASERVYRLAKVFEAAEDYFQDKAQVYTWLAQPKVALGGETPFAFARTAEGADYVVKLLGRMAHGVIS